MPLDQLAADLQQRLTQHARAQANVAGFAHLLAPQHGTPFPDHRDALEASTDLLPTVHSTHLPPPDRLTDQSKRLLLIELAYIEANRASREELRQYLQAGCPPLPPDPLPASLQPRPRTLAEQVETLIAAHLASEQKVRERKKKLPHERQPRQHNKNHGNQQHG